MQYASRSRALVAQLDRASGYGPEGRGFESSRARHFMELLVLAGGACLLLGGAILFGKAVEYLRGLL